MENFKKNNSTDLENKEIKNSSDEFLSFLKENGKISQLAGETNASFYNLNIAIKEKNFEEIEDNAKKLEAHIFWMTTFLRFVRSEATVIEINKNPNISEEKKKERIQFNKPETSIEIEEVKKFIGFYSTPDYRWEDGKVKTTRGEDSASYKLMKNFLDYLGVEIESVNE